MTRRSVVPALAVSLAAFGLFVVTLAPGLIAIEDTPKFQFIGRALGTSHNPGYPLFTMVSYVFGWLPLGNLAWRINLMSAVFAALTVALCQRTVVELGRSQWLGIAAGLGLATGVSFWSAATIAEVYTLHACLVAAMTWSLVRWRRTGHDRWFFVAIACFSLGLGHHTSIVMVGPAVAMFAIRTSPRFALAPRTMALILLLFALGFSQYLFVLIRTWQGGYLESSATNLHELWGVIRGAAWEHELRPVSSGTLEREGAPVLQTFLAEMSPLVAIAAVAGMAALARRDRALLALTLGSAVGVTTFALVFPGQTAFFLLPAYFFLWLLAAVGADDICGLFTGLNARAKSFVAVAPLLAMAVWHGQRNFETNDLSHRRSDMRYFDALTRQLPPHSALLSEDWLVDRLVLYEKFSDDTFNQRDLVTSTRLDAIGLQDLQARGYGPFAFGRTAQLLRFDGFEFDRTMWPMEYGSVREFLADQPAGTVVAFAVPALRLSTALAQDALPIEAIGGRPPASLATASNLVVIGTVGRTGALQAEGASEGVASIIVNRGLPIGTSRVISPTHILAEAGYDRASIRVDSREAVGSRWPVLALWNPHGEFLGTRVLTPEGRVPMAESPVSIHRLRATREWMPIGATPIDIAGSTTSGHVMVKAVTGAPLVIYAGRRQRLVPAIQDSLDEGFSLKVQEFNGGSAALDLALEEDRWPATPALRAMTHVYRIELPESSAPRQLAFGGIPDAAEARWSGTGEPAAIYGLDLMGQLESIDEQTDRMHVARDHHQLFLANGWSPIDADDIGGRTMTTGTQAEVLLPCAPHACATVDFQLRPVGDPDTVTLTVNGVPLASQPMQPDWQLYRWAVPGSALHAGVNSFVIHVGKPVFLGDVLVAKATR